MTRPLLVDLSESRDKSAEGGKAVNLGVLIRTGFPVPGGFVVTTEAYRNARGADIRDKSHPLAQQIVSRWQAMGAVPVAVRSSATAEDMAEASMAGQYDTFLDITSEESLLDAVQKCWASLDSPRTRSYLAEHGIDLAKVAMAVVVQELIPADTAGVMFSANPQTGSRNEMLIEAAWGLGEAVVSGRVQPDVLRVDRLTGRVLQAEIADKQLWIKPGSHEEQLVEETRRKVACLKSADVLNLWKLGLKAAEHFGAEQDMEWAIAGGRLFLLQSRPITTLAQAEAYETLLQSTRERLRERLSAGQGPWVLHNISETLKHPTPLTWSVVKRFMSGDGGFGAMYKEVGFEPSQAVCKDGFLFRIGGRAYMDTTLASEMFFEDFPFAYDLNLLRTNPDASQSPPTIPTGSMTQRMAIARKLATVNQKVREIARDFDQRLLEQIIPEFVDYCRKQKETDLSKLSAYELIDLWRQREHRVMDEFAPQSLIPSMIAGMAMSELRQTLDENFWDDDPDALASLLSSAHAPDKTLEGNAQLYEVATGARTVEQWLADHGHRAPDEFELATPRWRERPQELLGMAERLKSGPDPMDLHRSNQQRTRDRLHELLSRLPLADVSELDGRVELARRYLAFRETGKHYLMLGYDLLRDVALEAGRRLEVGEGVFQLTIEELFDALRIGYAPIHLILERQRTYEAERRASLPQVIDKESIETLGEPQRVEVAGSHKAFAVSSGVATGPARIVLSPELAGDLGKGYILVCPSTDPGWTPLFVNAAGLVLECGGTLSHGAVVAREMNIPAVVLPSATAIFLDGENITVDGRNGVVSRPGEEARPAELIDYRPGGKPGMVEEEAGDPLDTRIPRHLSPPPPGRRERLANQFRNRVAVGWGVFLALFFLLPDAWLYKPTFALMDRLFWPLVRGFGKPGATAIIAGGLALLVMILQRMLTDNDRLREAKRRSRKLDKLALKLPKGSPRRRAFLEAGAPVQMRIVGASFVPLAVLLGPMVISFLWFPPRVDPAAWNMPPGPNPGHSVTISAMIAADYTDPVELVPPTSLALAGGTTSAQSIPHVKDFLENTLVQAQKPNATASLGPGMQLLEVTYRQTVEDLRSYLKEGVPPLKLTWVLTTEHAHPGRYPVALKTASGHRVIANLVLGDAYPPGDTSITPDDGPIKSVQIEYSRPGRKPTFFAPLGFLGRTSIAYWDIGWLGVYLVVYVPVMFIARAALRVV